jgi:two-component system, NtrC family, response regulator AtoC
LPRLFEFFVVKYAKRYNRSEPALSPALRDAMQRYGWPGNIRELENTVKRFVILQDETLLQFELLAASRNRALSSSPPRPTAPLPQAEDSSPVPDTRAAAAATPSAGLNGNGNHNGHAKNGTPAAVSLADAARTAMLQAERDLIVPMLHRVHWNRRKAAPLLGISYKTLLNKIKEHGIIQE